jgi:hypothetical protein
MVGRWPGRALLPHKGLCGTGRNASDCLIAYENISITNGGKLPTKLAFFSQLGGEGRGTILLLQKLCISNSYLKVSTAPPPFADDYCRLLVHSFHSVRIAATSPYFYALYLPGKVN